MAEGTTGGDGLSNSAETGSRQEQPPTKRIQKLIGFFVRKRTLSPQPNPMSAEKSAGQAVEAVAPEAAEPAKLWYHYTSPEGAASIKTTGLQGSTHGSLGPGVYISSEPLQLAEPGRFEILTLQLQEKTNLLEVSWANGLNPIKTITALYGKVGAKLLKKEREISRNDSRKGWVYLQELAKDKGYDGFSHIDPMSGIKEVVIFDPKKLSLAESPDTEPVAQTAQDDIYRQGKK